MEYGVINAELQTAFLFNTEEINEAKKQAGLDPLGVDHGTVEPGLGIVLYEFGLLEPQEHYLIINRTLYAGNAVLYAYDENGETVDLTLARLASLNIEYLHGVEAVEKALRHGHAVRPYTAINDQQIAIWHNGALRPL